MSIKQGKGAEALPRGPLIIDALRPRQLPQIWQLRRLLIYLSMMSNLSTPLARLVSTGQNCGLVSRNRPVSTGFYKGFLVSFLVLNGKKVRFLQA